MRLRPGENDGVEAVEDPDGSDTTTFGHGFSLPLSATDYCDNAECEYRGERAAGYRSVEIPQCVVV